MMDIRQRVTDIGLTLPQAPQPVGNYTATIYAGTTLYISGQLPLSNGDLVYQGSLGRELTLKQGQQAAALCALNLLSHIEQALGQRRLKTLIKIEGYISACETFTQHAAVLDGASDLFCRVLGNKSGHVRTVLGCVNLPKNAAVEISAIVETQ